MTKKMIPPLRAEARPHMLLPTREKCNAMLALINLLVKLEVITNLDAVYIPAYSPGKTYYHS